MASDLRKPGRQRKGTEGRRGPSRDLRAKGKWCEKVTESGRMVRIAPDIRDDFLKMNPYLGENSGKGATAP
jgi:hypothetical protein